MKKKRIQYGTIVQSRGKWRAFFHPPVSGKAKLVVCDGAETREEAELALAIIKAEYLIQRLLREVGYVKAERLIRALDWCGVMASEVAR